MSLIKTPATNFCIPSRSYQFVSVSNDENTVMFIDRPTRHEYDDNLKYNSPKLKAGCTNYRSYIKKNA